MRIRVDARAHVRVAPGVVLSVDLAINPSVLTRLLDWPRLGNRVAGDCFIGGVGHDVRAVRHIEYNIRPRRIFGAAKKRQPSDEYADRPRATHGLTMPHPGGQRQHRASTVSPAVAGPVLHS